MVKTKKIIYIGNSGFPLGLAGADRQRQIAKGLIANGCDVTIINRYGLHDIFKQNPVLKRSTFEGIKFIYASGSPFREESFLKRNFLKLRGVLNEIRIILSKKRCNELDAIITSSGNFFDVILHSFLSSLCRVPSVLDNLEHRTSITCGIRKIDGYLYDNYSFKLVDKMICISDYLMDIARTKYPCKPLIKIPVITDYSEFKAGKKSKDDYFLFCGGAVYFEVINFVIDSFDQLQDNSHFLYIVSSGRAENMEKIRKRIGISPKSKRIKLFSGLKRRFLLNLYSGSKALLIPLRNTPQDLARFPHKIGEYCASGKAIISTNMGEVKNYFSNNVNALLAEEYDVKQFAEKMRIVIDNPAFSKELGQRAFKVGYKNFNHLVLGKKIYDFIFSPKPL